nr:methionine biosynthesis protein MetW [uncultured Halomonas sp.]
MRTDLELIYDWVPQGAHILDLACGDGVLLERLAQEKGVTGYGLEIDPDGITQCVARGVNVIEHNLDLIKTADWVIDMGPEAGLQGGQIVASGTPEQLAGRGKRKPVSHTGLALQPVLKNGDYQ